MVQTKTKAPKKPFRGKSKPIGGLSSRCRMNKKYWVNHARCDAWRIALAFSRGQNPFDLSLSA